MQNNNYISPECIKQYCMLLLHINGCMLIHCNIDVYAPLTLCYNVALKTTIFHLWRLSLWFHSFLYVFQQWVLVKYDPPQECISRPLRFRRFPLHFCVSAVVFAYSCVQTASLYPTCPMRRIQIIAFGQTCRCGNHSDRSRFSTIDVALDQEVRNSWFSNEVYIGIYKYEESMSRSNINGSVYSVILIWLSMLVMSFCKLYFPKSLS